MNRRQWLGLVPALALVLASGSALAAAKGSVSVDVNSATSLGGKELPAGRYNISWEGTESAAKVTFKSGGKVLAQADARVEQRDQPAPYDAVISRADGSGAKSVSEVRLRGKKTVLVIG